jgi:NAD(P)-dependent dehydrogenase (short-subunit alcohol dehydrogenase family)
VNAESGDTIHGSKQHEATIGKVAIITGASAGIGYEAARLFAREGAKVVVGARRQTELDALVVEIGERGGTAAALSGDVKDEAYAKELVELATNKFGGLDVALNNAGTLGELGVSVPQMALSEWENTLATSLTSAFLGAKYQIPPMLQRGGGSLIFTSSFVGYTVGFPQTAAYAASKADARRRIRSTKYTGKCAIAGRHRYANGPDVREHAGSDRICEKPSRA